MTDNYTIIQLYNYTIIQLYNYTIIQLYNYTIIQLYNYTIIQLYNSFMYFLKELSTRRDSNPRPSPWQGDTPPLSHSCSSYAWLFLTSTIYILHYNLIFVNAFFEIFSKKLNYSYILQIIYNSIL